MASSISCVHRLFAASGVADGAIFENGRTLFASPFTITVSMANVREGNAAESVAITELAWMSARCDFRDPMRKCVRDAPLLALSSPEDCGIVAELIVSVAFWE